MEIEQIKKLDPTRVIVLDTETTGLNPMDSDEILSLTIIDLTGTVIFDELVKPEHRKRWPKAAEINGITPAMVKDKQPLSAYRQQLQKLWQNIDLVVGYNIEYDTNFLYASSLNLTPKVEEFDVMREFAPIAGKWNEYHQDYTWVKLVDCAEHYGIGDFEAHSSLGDTEATRKCFLKLLSDPKYVELKNKARKEANKPNKVDIILIALGAIVILSTIINITKGRANLIESIILVIVIFGAKYVYDTSFKHKSKSQ